MIKRLQGSHGYALFMTMLIIVLFGILAVSLITVVVSGAQKNTIREHMTQAGELSEKGIEHITNQIHKDLDDIIGENGISKSHFLDELEALLNSYLCTNSSLDKINKTGEYFVCIENWQNGPGENGELRKEVTFFSKGLVDGKEKITKSTYFIGANDVPDALKYAVGSNRTCVGNNCIPGEGNLFIHGGASIQGDIKVDGDIITTNRGYAYLSGEKWIKSLYPSAIPGPNTKVSKLVLGGNVYTFSGTPAYDNHINRLSFESGIYTRRTSLTEAFEKSPELVSREPKREKIIISDQKGNFKFGFNDKNVTKLKNQVISNQNFPSKSVFPYYTRSYSCGFLGLSTCYEDTTKGDFEFKNDNTFGRFSTDGNLTIKSSKSKFGVTTIKESMYIEGNLTIGNGSNSYDPSQYDKIKLSGPIYVDGDLRIKGADAELNTLIYVNGNVIIEHSRINGLVMNGKEGSLIVFANGNIKIRNNSVNLDEPSNIRGYFYSEDAFEMFGVGSNIKINGGISARRIVLNAIRGRAKNRSFSGSQRITVNDYFEGVTEQSKRPSRLQIIYNPEIINTYSDLKQQEPVIYNVDPPELISRE